MHQQASASDVTLQTVVDAQVPAVVWVDAEKVAWATTVLVGNSLRYVRHGSRTPGGVDHVRVTYDPVGPRVAIEVQDDALGFP